MYSSIPALQMNNGKCGICGDNYADPQPRAHEAGGKSALGLVVRRYSKGQVDKYNF